MAMSTALEEDRGDREDRDCHSVFDLRSAPALGLVWFRAGIAEHETSQASLLTPL